MNSTPLRGLVLIMSAAFAICCGGDASLSPTAPTGKNVIRQPGAVIVGQVSNPPAPATSRSATGMPATAATLATIDSASVTVKVVGTNISTTTNQGQFTLTGVPPGEVQLEFSGRGGSATISISGVTADQEIHISVTLTGNNARVDSERRSRRGDGNREDQSELKGAVSGLTGNCPKVSFTVGGTEVTTSEITQFDQVRCGDIRDGVVVEVKGSRQFDNSIAATTVAIDDDEDDDNRNGSSRITARVEVKGVVSGLIGTCPKLSFMVGESTKVNTSESTRFDDVRCDGVRDRMVVEVTGVRQSDGSINATEVEIED
jgi:uncharacterized protein DUF5666